MSEESKQPSQNQECNLRKPTTTELRKQALKLIAEGHTELAHHIDGTKGELTKALNSLADRLVSEDYDTKKRSNIVNLEPRPKKAMSVWNEYTKSVGIKPGQKLNDEQKAEYRKWKEERKA